MLCFEILIAASESSTNGGPFVPDERLIYAIGDEAEKHLEPILAPYGQDPNWFFDALNFGRPPAPWALACLDREYEIAGHIATSRPANGGISFSPYTRPPLPLPDGFVPPVGVLVFNSKEGLKRGAANSSIFEAAWSVLRNRSTDNRWLTILDPLPELWLAEVLPGDREMWLAAHSVA